MQCFNYCLWRLRLCAGTNGLQTFTASTTLVVTVQRARLPGYDLKPEVHRYDYEGHRRESLR